MYNEELYHYGVKGMRWGHRKKYYNSDGSLSQLGQARQNYKNAKKAYNKSFTGRKKTDDAWNDVANKAEASRNARVEYKKAKQDYRNSEQGKAERQRNKATAIKVGAAAAGVALATYGAYKASKYLKSKAGQKAYDAGKKIMDKHMAEANKAFDLLGEKHISGADANRLTNEYTKQIKAYRQAAKETSSEVKRVSSSTKEAIKYLRRK